ncbi:MAG: hypothetical protein HDQ88_03565 [Clostridia bacterium]|nr:hypothetical protein [Clostridia bacterium]
MSKFRTSILIIGLLITVVVASLLTVLVLYATGTLITDPIELVYTISDADKIYDATPLTAENYALTSGELLEGHTAKVELLGSQTGAGVSQSDLTVKFYDEKGFDVSDEYAVKVIKGNLTVNPAEVSITLKDKEVEYNGRQVEFDDYEIEGDLVPGHKVAGSVENVNLIKAGDTLPEDLVPVILDAQGNIVTQNYNVDFHMGNVEVVQRKITIRPLSKSKIYDGTPLVGNEYEVVEGSLVSGQRVEADYYDIDGDEANLTVASQKRIVIDTDTLKIYDGDTDVTENYYINANGTGLLTVTKATLTVTAKSGTWEYDGTEHSFIKDKSPLSVSGLVNGEEIDEVNYSGRITNAGKEDNTIESVTLKGGKSINNYYVVKIDGTLEVTQMKLTVYSKNVFKTYDGKSLLSGLADSDLYETSPALPEDHSLVFDKSKDAFTKDLVKYNACSGAYILTVSAIDFDGEDCKNNFIISVVSGQYQINKAVITATLSNSLSETYTGSDITITASEAISNIKLNGQSIEDGEDTAVDASWFECTSATRLINAGEYYYNVKLADAEKALNYDLSIKDGKFKITKMAVALSMKPGSTTTVSVVYGTNDYNPPLESLMITNQAEYTVTSAVYERNGNTIKVTSVTVEDDSRMNITDNLQIDCAGASYTINYTPRSIAFEIDSFSYSGDGNIRDTEQLRVSLIRVSGATPLADGDRIVIMSTTRIDRNSFEVGEYHIYDKDGKEVTAYYTCTSKGYGTVVIG